MTTKNRAPRQSHDEADRGPLIGALLRNAYQALVEEMLSGLVAAGYEDVAPSHTVAVRPLWDHPEGLRATELAASAHMTKQSMGAIVDQLVQIGYAERVDDPADKRAKLIRLTKRGREAGRVTRNVVRRIEADWAKRIGAERLDLLRAILKDLLASLKVEA